MDISSVGDENNWTRAEEGEELHRGSSGCSSRDKEERREADRLHEYVG